MPGEKGGGFVYGELQHVENRLPSEGHLQDLLLKSTPITYLAGHFDVRQKVHLQQRGAQAGARFAAPARPVEREIPRFQASGAGQRCLGKKVPDFALEDSKGDIYRLSDFQGKKTVVLEFFRSGSW